MATVALWLRDGTRTELRPIEPDDRSDLRKAFQDLSSESRYRRFLSATPRLSDRQLEYLT